MKKIIAVLVIGLSTSMLGHAKDSLDGCGIGWEVTDKKTFTATTTRGTTNAFIPPTFGMTTGTMGCEKLDIGKNDKAAADYVATNFEQLKSALATGEGEYVQALSESFGCTDSKAVGSKIQSQYNSVVAPAKNAVQLYKGLRAELAGMCG